MHFKLFKITLAFHPWIIRLRCSKKTSADFHVAKLCSAQTKAELLFTSVLASNSVNAGLACLEKK